MTDNYSLSDIATVAGNNNGWGDNGSWWIILFLIFAFAGFGNNGYGGGVANNYVLASDFATLQRQLDSGFATQERRTDSIINGICDLGYNNAQLVNGVNTNLMTQGYETRNAINAVQTQMASCCCDLKQGISGINYNMSLNTRDLIDNQNANTRAILDKMCQQEIDAKNEKIAEQNQKINALELSASQALQNQYLISQLKPAPVPAFTVPNPNIAYYGGCCNS